MSVMFSENSVSFTFKDSESIVVREYGNQYAILEAVVEADEFGGDFRAARDGLFIAREFGLPIHVSIRPYGPAETPAEESSDDLEPSELEEMFEVQTAEHVYGDPVQKPYDFAVQLIGNVSGGAFKVRLIGKESV